MKILVTNTIAMKVKTLKLIVDTLSLFIMLLEQEEPKLRHGHH